VHDTFDEKGQRLLLGLFCLFLNPNLEDLADVDLRFYVIPVDILVEEGNRLFPAIGVLNGEESQEI